ncbi:hypothetical protein COCSUDRAFT_63167 [Coccomyxa subellipsoidea C-169]|uniref:Uncharacterized protein n=1 Tax=Coccomyxa subellipsoidea (strain C-169) TaxID=574566 RepID=I0YZ20_COCSC|nr:hypothetical protein COCSUDRAFT_63167 [Coccomyxa subellipsoidea C-169]EIE23639.1 hypothetical protein COCSUDRAFT_63167 [Coccomyxa subellipsoidea C-169]|eukprot:XP_005648183.1 hypothetical protein COCSUDRAFT_63167 [Coccomyxa subellipsoidea C-169]
MPDFHAVQCFQCSVFQVYAISGKASDVRGVVTKLNARRQQADEARDQALINGADKDDHDLHSHVEQHDTAGTAEVAADTADIAEQPPLPGAACYVTELPTCQRGAGRRDFDKAEEAMLRKRQRPADSSGRGLSALQSRNSHNSQDDWQRRPHQKLCQPNGGTSLQLDAAARAGPSMGQAAVVEAPSGVQQSKAGKAGSMWDAFDEDDAFPEADLGTDDRSEHAVMGDTDYF